MGKIYSHTSDGKKLRRRLSLQEIARLTSYYKRHHQLLAAAVKRELAMHGQTLIVDCHSFPNKPLPCDMDQSSPRQDFCIGTDSFHTPIALAQTVKLALTREGCNVQFNHPYAGTMIPLEFYGKDCRVLSIMIEINRSLYMNEATGERSNGFDALRQAIHKHLRSLAEFPHRR